MEISLLVIVASVFFFAGVVKGVIGIGLPTLAMGLLCLFMPALEAAALLVVPAVATNIWQMLAGPALRRLLRRFAIMGVALIGGTLATVGMFARKRSLSLAMLGAALAAYGLSGFYCRRFKFRRSRALAFTDHAGLPGLKSHGIFVIPDAYPLR